MLNHDRWVELYRALAKRPVLSVYRDGSQHDPAARNKWRIRLETGLDEARRRLAGDALQEFDARSRVAILLTDGKGNVHEIGEDSAIDDAVKAGIKVYTIGAGTNGSAPVRVDLGDGQSRLVHTQVAIDEVTLRKIADDGIVVVSTGGGDYTHPRGTAVRVAGGYRVTGRWPFGTGCQESAWMLGSFQIIDGGQPRPSPDGSSVHWRGLFERSEVRIVEGTWDVAGLRATGSFDWTVEDVFLPERRTMVHAGVPLDNQWKRWPGVSYSVPAQAWVGPRDVDALLVGGLEPRRHVPARDEQGVAGGDGEPVPEAEDQAPVMKEPISRRAAEGARGVGHARFRSGGGLISSCPESPAATQAAQRHVRTGRHAVRWS